MLETHARNACSSRVLRYPPIDEGRRKAAFVFLLPPHAGEGWDGGKAFPYGFREVPVLE